MESTFWKGVRKRKGNQRKYKTRKNKQKKFRNHLLISCPTTNLKHSFYNYNFLYLSMYLFLYVPLWMWLSWSLIMFVKVESKAHMGSVLSSLERKWMVIFFIARYLHQMSAESLPQGNHPWTCRPDHFPHRQHVCRCEFTLNCVFLPFLPSPSPYCTKASRAEWYCRALLLHQLSPYYWQVLQKTFLKLHFHYGKQLMVHALYMHTELYLFPWKMSWKLNEGIWSF